MINAQVRGTKNVARLLNKVLPEEFENELSSTVNTEAQKILSMGQANVPTATGKTKSQLKIKRSRKGLVAKIGIFRSADRGYVARFLEWGVKAHLIKPKNRKALKIGSGFAESVMHPGIKPRGWFVASSNNMRAEFQQRMREAMLRVLRKVNNS